MKKWKIIVGIASIALLVGTGFATYKEPVQIDLGSGMIRDLRKSLGLTNYHSPPQQSTISQALVGPIRSSKWLRIREEGVSYPRARTNPCYPRILFWVEMIDRASNNHKVTAITAKMALEELGATKDPSGLKRHLKRFWNALGDDLKDSWDDSRIGTKIPRIWQRTTTNQAGSTKGE